MRMILITMMTLRRSACCFDAAVTAAAARSANITPRCCFAATLNHAARYAVFASAVIERQYDAADDAAACCWIY